MDRRYAGRTFHAIDRHGGIYLLTPLYRAASESDELPLKTWAVADCVGLLTSDGRSAERTGKGCYLLNAEGPAMFSDDLQDPRSSLAI